jgi:hypothetical protein
MMISTRTMLLFYFGHTKSQPVANGRGKYAQVPLFHYGRRASQSAMTIVGTITMLSISSKFLHTVLKFGLTRVGDTTGSDE